MTEGPPPPGEDRLPSFEEDDRRPGPAAEERVQDSDDASRVQDSDDEARGILNDLLSDLPGVVYRCRNDQEWTMLGLTANVEDLTGYPPSALIQNNRIPFAELIHPDDRDRVWSEVQKSVNSGESFRLSYRIRTREDEERWVLEQGRATRDEEGNDPLLTGYIQDITGPVADLLESQQDELEEVRQQRRLIELLQTVTSVVNEHRSLRRALEAALPEICAALACEVGHAFLADPDPGTEGEPRSTDIWYLEDGVEGLEAFRDATNRPTWNVLEGLPGRVMKRGSPEWVEDVKGDPDFLRVDESDPSPVRSGLGAPIVSGTRTLAVVEIYWVERRSRDPDVEAVLSQIGVQLGRVWEREEAAREQRKSEERFRQIAESIDDVFWISTPGTEEILYVSPAYREIWGREPQSLYRRDQPDTWLRTLHPEDRERIRAALPSQVEGSYEVEYRVVRPDGDVRWIWDRAFPVTNEDGEVVRIVGVAEDITERKELERQLGLAQKMEAVGRLAGGIAHDFNNILTVISAQSDLLLLDFDESHPLRGEVELIRSSAERAARLTGQLLAFSREQVLRPRVLDLRDIVTGMMPLLRRVLGEDIRIVTRMSGDLPAVRVDPGQLEQVLMNLVVNAREAMPGGGVLEISTGVEVLSEDEAAERPGLWPGSCVFLQVSDTGTGMDAETRSRVFEPFFTTRREQGGTGLGLAVSYGIVKQSGGAIHVDSRPGKGATFKIRFPPAHADAESGPTSTPDDLEGTDPTLTGSVLAIEDDPSVRRIVQRILQRAGMDATLAEDAETGLQILVERGESFEVVLTDLVLPGMSGRGLLEEIRSRGLDVQVVVMSGYDHDSPGRRGVLPADVWFIQKPFSPEELIEVLGRALRNHSSKKE
ncbi:MAG: PAS domain-containing protein [Longimicrobiales bacterium]